MQTENKVAKKQNVTDDCISASELVHRHLSNQDHEISDSDLQKVALDCKDGKNQTKASEQVNNDPTSMAMNLSYEEEIEQDDTEEEKKEKDVIITPLDVIS